MLSHRRARQPAIGAGVLRVGGDRLPERSLRPLAVEVVELARRLGPQRSPIRRWRRGGRRNSGDQIARSARRCGCFPSGARPAILRPCRACASLYLLHTIAVSLRVGGILTPLTRSPTLDKVETGTAHGHEHAHEPRSSRRAGLLAQVRVFAGPQGHRHPVRDHRPPVSALRLLPDDADAVSAGLSGPARSR